MPCPSVRRRTVAAGKLRQKFKNPRFARREAWAPKSFRTLGLGNPSARAADCLTSLRLGFFLLRFFLFGPLRVFVSHGYSLPRIPKLG
jgi:hypothetical protein